MTFFTKLLVGVAGASVAAAVPASAQTYYPPPQSPYNQGYGQGGVIGQVIDQVLGGGRYGAYGQGNDRMAVDQCARAVEARVSNDNRRGVYGSYNRNYAGQRYGSQTYPGYYAQAQVVGITGVQRQRNGLRVTGLIDTRMGRNQGQYGHYNQYGQYSPSGQPYSTQGYGQPGYGSPGYGAQSAELRFSCRIDYRGRVTDIDINRNRRG
jgi:hypothetical protein